jgi:hypothetical protein
MNDASYDVIVIGGSIAGAARRPCRCAGASRAAVLIVEKAAAFGRGVGESTVEVSSYYLGHVLDLSRYLNEEHLVKHGMRFWFANADTRSLDDCSEIGNRYQLRLPTYQVDRAKLNAEVPRRAVAWCGAPRGAVGAR